MVLIAQYIVCSCLVDQLLLLFDILLMSLEDVRTKDKSWFHCKLVLDEAHLHAVVQQVQN